MPDVLDDDTDALAAEFVLGTLDADERAHANLLLDIDDAFRAKVKVWERRLGELHLMVEPVQPAPQIWERIKVKLESTPRAAEIAPVPEPTTVEAAASEALVDSEPEPDAAGAPLEITLDALEAELRKVGRPDQILQEEPAQAAAEERPESAPEIAGEPDIEAPFEEAKEKPPGPIAEDQPAEHAPAIPAPAPAAVLAAEKPTELVEDLRSALFRWRIVALMLSTLAVFFIGMFAAWRFAPDDLPLRLRPTTVFRIPTLPPAPPVPPKPKAPPESVFDE
jgi:hypothetical protein